MGNNIRIGVSTCLLGEAVRYDGADAMDPYVSSVLGQFVELVPVCPEVEAGFGIPREPVQLEGDADSPHMVTVNTGKDLTSKMLSWTRRRVRELEKEGLWGFIFKSKSPSCGIERVKVYTERQTPVKKGRGLFARAFMEHFPLIPVEEESRLHDLRIRENFIERIFTLERWRRTVAKRKSLGSLIEFHTAQELLILSHSLPLYREIGKLVAAARGRKLSELYAGYQELLVKALRMNTTTRKHLNVLQHVLSKFKKKLTPEEKQELLETIEKYRKGDVPLLVPVTLLNHYTRKYEQSHLYRQLYLNPHPVELKLRNHA
ncbi:MAG: DUF1722 domain-containing protein [Deltaproteobacteria bacterium]|nr:DUF1722 domain-containing protein [Deltaproteobacteria bacterium]